MVLLEQQEQQTLVVVEVVKVKERLVMVVQVVLV
jgi:hypothetical protein